MREQILPSKLRLCAVWLNEKGLLPGGARRIGIAEPKECDAMFDVDCGAAVCCVRVAADGLMVLMLCLVQLVVRRGVVDVRRRCMARLKCATALFGANSTARRR